jgi:hypothetical protein
MCVIALEVQIVTQNVSIRNIVIAFGLHAVQTTPYIATASLLVRHNLVAVLGAVLVLALCVLSVFYAAKRILAIPTPSNLQVSTGVERRALKYVLAGFFAVVSSVNWLAHMTTIARFGPVVGVTVALASGILTLWIAQFILQTQRHKAFHLAGLLLATVLVVFAFLVIARDRIDLGGFADGYATWDGLISLAPLLVLTCGIAIATVLKAALSDPFEARLHRFLPFRTFTLVALELAAAATVAIILNFYLDGFASMAALAPDSIDPHTWTWDHWGLLWVGVVNTALGLLVLTSATNLIGVPVMTAVGQSRPALAELLQIIFGFAAITIAGVSCIALTCILLFAATLALRWRTPVRVTF